MCGFTGFVSTKRLNEQLIQSMADQLIHRGPDDSGYENIYLKNQHIAMGFRRLSIIDLSANGHQPMKSKDQRVMITFNGEIYNHDQIRQELIQLGYQFLSESDTEVVLNSYLQWGINAIEKFIGMFAIAILDLRENCLKLIRDRAGVKPLYWYWDGKSFIYGSELKALVKHTGFHKEIDLLQLSAFFQKGYIPTPGSIYKNTYKLEAASVLVFDLKSKEIRKNKYWNAADSFNEPVLQFGFVDAKTELKKLFKSAFEYRMLADVPVGIFLSGGYDSSLVAATLQQNRTDRIQTFTIGFEDEKHNEAHAAREIAQFLRTDHHEFICKAQDAREKLEKWADIYDEPFGDTSGIPTTLVAEMARNHVTVALSADGGDEQFAGYMKYQNALKRFHQLSPFSSSWGRLVYEMGKIADKPHKENKLFKLSTFLQSTSIHDKYQSIINTASSHEVKKWFKHPESLANSENVLRSDLTHSELLRNFRYIDYMNYLSDDILQKVDRATMYNSLEGREPLLDHRILEFSARLPDHFLINKLGGKRIIKDLVHEMIPRQLVERPKKGFTIPLSDWLKNELRDLFEMTFDDHFIRRQGIFNPKIVQELKYSFLNKGNTEEVRIHYFFLFQLWYLKWMNE